MATDWNGYKPGFERTLGDMPANREAVKGAVESFGQHVATKAKQLDIPQDEIVSALRTGLQQGQGEITGSRR
jgi:hypothetical protein